MDDKLAQAVGLLELYRDTVEMKLGCIEHSINSIKNKESGENKHTSAEDFIFVLNKIMMERNELINNIENGLKEMGIK